MTDQTASVNVETTIPRLARVGRILDEVGHEVIRQHDLWGQQDHPDRAASLVPRAAQAELESSKAEADRIKRVNDALARRGEIGWDTILLEEVYEALAESDPAKIRAELVQVAAVAQSWIAAIDRRSA